MKLRNYLEKDQTDGRLRSGNYSMRPYKNMVETSLKYRSILALKSCTSCTCTQLVCKEQLKLRITIRKIIYYLYFKRDAKLRGRKRSLQNSSSYSRITVLTGQSFIHLNNSRIKLYYSLNDMYKTELIEQCKSLPYHMQMYS